MTDRKEYYRNYNAKRPKPTKERVEKGHELNQKWHQGHRAQVIERLKQRHAIHKETDNMKRKERWHAASKEIAYRWHYADGRCAYVGKGTPVRAACHKTRSPWWLPSMTLVISEPFPTEWDAMIQEAQWGKEFDPIHNKDGKRKRGSISAISEQDNG